MAETVHVRSGMGLFGWLTVLFVGLKLTGYIDWSWWWVLSPVLFGVGLALLFMLLVFGFFLIAELLDR